MTRFVTSFEEFARAEERQALVVMLLDHKFYLLPELRSRVVRCRSTSSLS